jgi:hypothetical protein
VVAGFLAIAGLGIFGTPYSFLPITEDASPILSKQTRLFSIPKRTTLTLLLPWFINIEIGKHPMNNGSTHVRYPSGGLVVLMTEHAFVSADCCHATMLVSEIYQMVDVSYFLHHPNFRLTSIAGISNITAAPLKIFSISVQRKAVGHSPSLA